MTSPRPLKRTYGEVLEIVKYSNTERLELLNKLINESTSPADLPSYYAKRALLHYELKNYNDVLNDINRLKSVSNLSEEMSVVMWKSILHAKVQEIRHGIKEELIHFNLDHINEEKLNLLDSLSEKNIEQLFMDKENGKKLSVAKRRR